jgi:hypothetical protein
MCCISYQFRRLLSEFLICYRAPSDANCIKPSKIRPPELLATRILVPLNWVPSAVAGRIIYIRILYLIFFKNFNIKQSTISLESDKNILELLIIIPRFSVFLDVSDIY